MLLHDFFGARGKHARGYAQRLLPRWYELQWQAPALPNLAALRPQQAALRAARENTREFTKALDDALDVYQ